MTSSQLLHKSKTHKPGNDPACPVCVRHSKLSETLEAIQARQIASIEGPNGSTLGFYSTRNGVLIVQWFAEEHGFEVYTPICDSAKIDDTLNAMRSFGVLKN